MKRTVSVAISGSAVQMQLHAARLWGKKPTLPAAAVREAVSNDLPAALDAAAAGLESAFGRSLAGSKLEATLGLHHSYVGVCDLGDLAESREAAVMDQAVAAWVMQTYRVNASQVTIRWRRIRGTRCALVSCIRTDAVEALTAFAQRLKLRFASCQPALHSALETHAAKAPRKESTTLIWTEWQQQSGRDPLIQLNCFDGGTLVSTWRGWVPDGEPGLAGALSRFHHCNGVSAAAAVRHELWPSPQPDRAREVAGV